MTKNYFRLFEVNQGQSFLAANMVPEPRKGVQNLVVRCYVYLSSNLGNMSKHVGVVILRKILGMVTCVVQNGTTPLNPEHSNTNLLLSSVVTQAHCGSHSSVLL